MGTSILSRVIPVNQVTKGGLKMNVYGRPKTGKTVFACTFPKPLLILGTEDGTQSVKNIAGVNFLRIVGNKSVPVEVKENYVHLDELADLFQELTKSDYKTIVLDTASGLQDLVYTDVMGLEDTPIMKMLPSKNQNQLYSSRTRALIRDILKIPKNVVIIAHEKEHIMGRGDDEEQVESSASEMVTPLISSALSSAVCRFLFGEVDYICQTFVREEVIERVVETKNEKRVIQSKGQKIEYCLGIGPHPIYTRGFRYSSQDPKFKLPDVVVNPTYDKIVKLIQGQSI